MNDVFGKQLGQYVLHEQIGAGGRLHASELFSGLTSAEAFYAIAAWLAERGRGEKRVNFRLRDWGVRGIMVDFMDRDDQPMVGFYRRVAEEAAKRRLFVDFHGAFKPTGLERRFPNALTREGLVASEWNKWSEILTPEYEVSLPFIRGMAGPLDYEPGHMRNAQKDAFRVLRSQPMSQGTRVHQAAMYVVYESPWAKMGGNVSYYLREPDFTAFLASVPTLWEETHGLDGAVGDFVVTQRVAAGGDVWVGAMTDWTARELALDLAFLGEGRWQAEVLEDGPNADRYGADWRQYMVSFS